MKKTILFLGLATMICATPVFAATSTKMAKPVVATHATSCMLHGKKVACAKHASVKTHKMQVAAKKK